MNRDPTLEIVNNENRAHICCLGPIQPTDVDFPQTIPQTAASNGSRYRFQVSVMSD